MLAMVAMEKNSCQGYISWTQFVADLYEHFDTDTNHLGHLKKLKQLGTVEDFIVAFERLDFRTEGMSDAFFRECFINGLKDEIQAHVLARPESWVEATKRDKEAQQVVSSQNRKPSFIPHPKPVNPTTPSALLKIQKLTRDEMVECQIKVFVIIVMTNISRAKSVNNKCFLSPSLRRFWKKMKKLPLCQN
jgi:hypothetical protein